jgi:flagellar motility protein MotE (MotC chaperone)
MGLVGIENAQATLQPQAVAPVRFGKEEVKVLTSLDSRRAELTERSKALDDREKQLSIRDREFAVRVAQLKELTDQLKNDREKSDKKRSAQIEQLANVYGSMSPQEAAQLMEQLDVQIALSLIERMPEKKIGQILALMSKERALTLTKMLSGKAQG